MTTRLSETATFALLCETEKFALLFETATFALLPTTASLILLVSIGAVEDAGVDVLCNGDMVDQLTTLNLIQDIYKTCSHMNVFSAVPWFHVVLHVTCLAWVYYNSLEHA